MDDDGFRDALSGDLWRCAKCNLVYRYHPSQPGCPRCRRREKARQEKQAGEKASTEEAT